MRELPECGDFPAIVLPLFLPLFFPFFASNMLDMLSMLGSLESL